MELSIILDLISVTAVILGLLFGLVQLRHYHLSREREAALDLLNSIQTGEFFKGIWTLQKLANRLAKKKLEDRLGDEMRLV